MNRSARQAGGVLPRILSHKAEEVRELLREGAAWRAAAEAAPRPPSFEAALRAGPNVAVIGEVKRRSPSAGALAPALDPGMLARAYAAGGAAAVSVVTDERYFGGSVADLGLVGAAVGLPMLRKDFILHPVQLWQARAAGAAAVLLIVRALADPELTALHARAVELGLGALVEVHDAAELERALAAGARVVGVNHRDLDTLTVDPGNTARLAPLVPADVLLVGESGVRGPEDVVRLAQVGADAVLVGEALIRSPDPAALVRGLAAVPRERRS